MKNFCACWCALPSMRGNTDCCKECANNPGNNKDDIDWQPFDIDEIKKGRMKIEYDSDGRVIKITYLN